MSRNILTITITVLICAVLAAGGYLFYQKNILEQANLLAQQDKANETSGIVNRSADNLPVSNDPGGAGIPIDTGQPIVQPGQADKRQPNSQQAVDEQKKQNAEFLDISKWKTYTNEKYNYSFKFPKEYDYSPCDDKNPCKFGQAFEKDGGDMAWVAGNLSNQGWPNIVVTHVDNESFTLPKDKSLIDWAREKFGITDKNKLPDYNVELATKKGNLKKGVRISIPQSPQAYAREEIYFENSQKIFQIQLMDSNKVPAKEIYDTWLKTFVAE